MGGRYLLLCSWFLVPVGLVLDQVATHRLDAFGVEVDLVVFVCSNGTHDDQPTNKRGSSCEKGSRYSTR